MQINLTPPIRTVACLTNGFVVYETIFDGEVRYCAATKQTPLVLSYLCEHNDLLRFVRELGQL